MCVFNIKNKQNQLLFSIASSNRGYALIFGRAKKQLEVWLWLCLLSNLRNAHTYYVSDKLLNILATKQSNTQNHKRRNLLSIHLTHWTMNLLVPNFGPLWRTCTTARAFNLRKTLPTFRKLRPLKCRPGCCRTNSTPIMPLPSSTFRKEEVFLFNLLREKY